MDLIKYIGIGSFGWLYYYAFNNISSENNIEKKILKLSLSIEEYCNDKKRLGKQKIHLIFEIANFIILLCFSMWVLQNLFDIMGLNSIKSKLACCLIAFLLSNLLYVYGNQDDDVKEERKNIICTITIFIWIIFVVKRIQNYIYDSVLVNYVDIILLIFSLIFVIPKINIWIKNIFKKIYEPYMSIIENRSQELIMEYSWKAITTKMIKKVVKFKITFKTVKSKIIETWKSNQRLKMIFLLLHIIAIIILTIFYIKYQSLIINILNKIIVRCYDNLKIETKQLISRGLEGIFFVVISFFLLYRLPIVIKQNKSFFDKISTFMLIMCVETFCVYYIYLIIIQ